MEACAVGDRMHGKSFLKAVGVEVFIIASL